MIKLGMLDFDTSHCAEFTKRLNHKDISQDQWIEGAQVVIACPGESQIDPKRIVEYTTTMQKLGVPLVDRPEEMIGKVDGMMIESQQGGPHWRRAKPFLKAGIPCFVDKPFACSSEDAKEMAKLAAKQNIPISKSSPTI